MGCLGEGEAARGEHLIANQGQEWMGICTTSIRSWFSKEVKREVTSYKRGQVKARTGSKGMGWLKNRCMLYIYAYMCRYVLSANNIALCLG